LHSTIIPAHRKTKVQIEGRTMPLAPRDIDQNKLYTVEETAAFLSLSEQTVRKHLRERRLTGKKIGRKWHIRGSVIRRFIES
jgi:excisionase family DNA binding protein